MPGFRVIQYGTAITAGALLLVWYIFPAQTVVGTVVTSAAVPLTTEVEDEIRFASVSEQPIPIIVSFETRTEDEITTETVTVRRPQSPAPAETIAATSRPPAVSLPSAQTASAIESVRSKPATPVAPEVTVPVRVPAVAVGAPIDTGLIALRKQHQLQPLWADARLHKIATARSRDMATRNYFSHTNPDGCGISCQFTQSGLPATRFAENIGWYAPYTRLSETALADHFLTAWMESQGHRENLLTPELTHYGVGTALAGDKVIITMIFAHFE